MLNEKTSYAAALRGWNSDWGDLLHLGMRTMLPRRSVFILEDEAMFDFYYLQSGKMRIMHSSSDGSERTMLHIDPGMLFNESTALCGFDEPGCQMQSLEDSVIYRFPRTLLHDTDFIASHPKLIAGVMQGLAAKVLIMHCKLSNTSTDNAVQRLARFLCGLVSLKRSLSFDPNTSQDDLAAMLGVHRATVVRALASLRQSGALVSFTKRRAVIGDLARLQSIAGMVHADGS